jgi:hypothetical protein
VRCADKIVVKSGKATVAFCTVPHEGTVGEPSVAIATRAHLPSALGTCGSAQTGGWGVCARPRLRPLARLLCSQRQKEASIVFLHHSSFAMRWTVPVPMPSDLATFKIPTPFASCFRTFRSVALSIFGRPSFTP